MPDRLEIVKPELEIDADLIAQFEALDSYYGVTWTKQMDALLLKYWPIKRHQDVARLLNVNPATALKRYKTLTEGAK